MSTSKNLCGSCENWLLTSVWKGTGRRLRGWFKLGFVSWRCCSHSVDTETNGEQHTQPDLQGQDCEQDMRRRSLSNWPAEILKWWKCIFWSRLLSWQTSVINWPILNVDWSSAWTDHLCKRLHLRHCLLSGHKKLGIWQKPPETIRHNHIPLVAWQWMAMSDFHKLVCTAWVEDGLYFYSFLWWRLRL